MRQHVVALRVPNYYIMHTYTLASRLRLDQDFGHIKCCKGSCAWTKLNRMFPGVQSQIDGCAIK